MEDVMPSEVDKAKEFWSNVDVNIVFDALYDRLRYLRERIEADSATHREFIVGMNIILASELYISPKSETDPDEEAMLYDDILPVAVTDGDSEEWDLERELLQENSRESPSFGPDTPPAQPGTDKLPRSPSALQFERGDLSPLLPTQSENQELLPAPSPGRTEREALLPPLGPAHTGASPILPPVVSPPSGRASPMAPLSPLLPLFQPHSCSWICLPRPTLSTEHRLRGRNPLKLPLFWGFQRQHATPPGAPEGVVFYKAPCGRSLRGPEEACRFLREAEADAHLHAGLFSFSAAVQLHRREHWSARELLDPDLSRGAEPVPVALWNGLDGARPERFRYRAHRRPRGCLPPTGPVFTACCACPDACTDPALCACLQTPPRPAQTPPRPAQTPPRPAQPSPRPAQTSPRPTPATLYHHGRLARPTPAGLYECGPWCGCDRARCQNRVVQRGLQVRLQVFRTPDRGWGVRCIDDLDQGTFVCTYTGVVLRAGLDSGASCLGAVTSDPSPHKRRRGDQSSDDEVEVVEEWRVDPAGPTNPDPTTPPHPSSGSPPVHVSVIKTPTGPAPPPDDSEQTEPQSGGTERGTSPSSVSHTAENGKEAEPGLDSEWAWLGAGADREEGHAGVEEEHLYYLDATEEGNVGRFLNHSCCPNLFVQNFFIDSHHRDFPTIAFFTSRVVTAGTELTWNYSYDPGSVPEQEVPCQCGCESCRGVVI
ncbi:histone-lysine N-methyltransferase SETDB2 isoform X2 [Conger conger]|uniref:histone-lysine N-methyltransferase SETDB2 isoform X2 n=1 Tax=Conger conger TaxID=82655 RepID=UPI002A5A6FB1|nr:histone-lysine N-methyltransferase SETDB2 isoform X2 [Conger conger]